VKKPKPPRDSKGRLIIEGHIVLDEDVYGEVVEIHGNCVVFKQFAGQDMDEANPIGAVFDGADLEIVANLSDEKIPGFYSLPGHGFTEGPTSLEKLRWMAAMTLRLRQTAYYELFGVAEKRNAKVTKAFDEAFDALWWWMDEERKKRCRRAMRKGAKP
jgi:hypothetical protein